MSRSKPDGQTPQRAPQGPKVNGQTPQRAPQRAAQQPRLAVPNAVSPAVQPASTQPPRPLPSATNHPVTRRHEEAKDPQETPAETLPSRWPEDPRTRRLPADRRDQRPHILHVADVRDWAFDINGRAMAAYLPEFHWEFAYVIDRGLGGRWWPDLARFDGVFLPYHRWHIEPSAVPWHRTYGSLRSQWFWPERPGPPDAAAVDIVNRFRRFYVNTREALDGLAGRCPAACYLSNPVDTKRFVARPASAAPIVACWSGNARHAGGRVKGLFDIVVPACTAASVPLRIAEYHTHRIAPTDMPAWLRGATVAVYASKYEGCSNALLEAMASGLAILTTDVGNAREVYDEQMAKHGESGIELLPREPLAFSAALRRLAASPWRVARMGAINAAATERAWSWTAWRDRFADFFADTRPARRSPVGPTPTRHAQVTPTGR